MLEKDLDSEIFGLCSSLMAMAETGRKDALSLLFGIAWRNRDNYPRMISIIRAVSPYRHPEFIELIASELIRVPSSPASRTYLRTLLKELLRAGTEQSEILLAALENDKRLGTRYRATIKEYFQDREIYEF